MSGLRYDIPDALIDQAITWSVKLRSGTTSREQIAACDAWRAAAADHERAWQYIQQVEAPFASVAVASASAPAIAGVARRTLEHAHAQPQPNQSRRRTLRHLTVATMAGALGYAAYTRFAVQGDYTTTVAQRRTVLLPDGTRLVLNSASAADVRYTADARTVVLRSGEILVETGHRSVDGRPLPPFWVVTPQSRMQALGTRFVVSLTERSTVVQVEEGAVGVFARGADRPVVVRPGEAKRLDDDGTIAAIAAQPEVSAWIDGTVVAESMRLGELIERLSRYRDGWLSCAPEVAQLRVSGVFSLDDTDLALNAVARSLPVRVVHRTAYWVRVVAA